MEWKKGSGQMTHGEPILGFYFLYVFLTKLFVSWLLPLSIFNLYLSPTFPHTTTHDRAPEMEGDCGFVR